MLQIIALMSSTRSKKWINQSKRIALGVWTSLGKERPQDERDDANSENPHAKLSLTHVGPHICGDGSIAYIEKVKTLQVTA